MNRPPKVYIDTFFHLFQTYNRNEKKEFPATREVGRTNYFAELAKHLCEYYKNAKPKPFVIKKDFDSKSLGDYLRKYSNIILLNLQMIKSDNNLLDEYFHLFYCYSFGEKYSDLKTHLGLVESKLLVSGTGPKVDKPKKIILKENFFRKIKEELGYKGTFYIESKRVVPWKEYFAQVLNLDINEVSRSLSSYPGNLVSLACKTQNPALFNDLEENKIFSKPQNLSFVSRTFSS